MRRLVRPSPPSNLLSWRVGSAREVARVTGLEPATSGVTGRRSNQLSYTRVFWRGGDLGGGLFGVNHRWPHFAPCVLFLLIGVTDVSQRPVLEEETGDVRRARGGENGLHDDEQRNGEERARRAPHPRPEGQGYKDRQ